MKGNSSQFSACVGINCTGCYLKEVDQNSIDQNSSILSISVRSSNRLVCLFWDENPRTHHPDLKLHHFPYCTIYILLNHFKEMVPISEELRWHCHDTLPYTMPLAPEYPHPFPDIICKSQLFPKCLLQLFFLQQVI